MPVKECNRRCEGCALTEGAAANNEPWNNLTAMLAVLGPFPFYCHDTFDWQNTDGRNQARTFIRENGFVLCSGWMEQVRELAETGYYKENPIITKCKAISARGALELFLATDDQEEKDESSAEMFRILTMLGDKKRRFEGELNK